MPHLIYLGHYLGFIWLINLCWCSSQLMIGAWWLAQAKHSARRHQNLAGGFHMYVARYSCCSASWNHAQVSGAQISNRNSSSWCFLAQSAEGFLSCHILLPTSFDCIEHFKKNLNKTPSKQFNWTKVDRWNPKYNQLSAPLDMNKERVLLSSPNYVC